MKRINVVVATHNMNNWDVLCQGEVLRGGDYEVYFHRDPQMSIRGAKAFFNFDVAINDGSLKIDGMDIQGLLPAKRMHIIKRYNKVEQQLRLWTAIELNSVGDKRDLFKNFYPVTMHHNPQMNGFSQLVNSDSRVVVKPLDGARGIGQFLIDPDQIPLTAVVDILDGLKADRIKLTEVLPEIRKYDPTFNYPTASDKFENEGLTAIKSQGFCIQDYVPGIVAEYRLLTGQDGEVAYCQRRTISDTDGTGLAQATGSQTNSAKGDDICAIVDILAEDDYLGLTELVRSVIGPLSSVDLFITREGRWGIFEYCNQFGMKGVPIGLAQSLHAELVLRLIEKAGL